jgi:hypothetical protein
MDKVGWEGGPHCGIFCLSAKSRLTALQLDGQVG